jgi:hypothetical protein
LLQIFRQWRRDAYGKAEWVIFDLFQSDPALGTFGDAAG